MAPFSKTDPLNARKLIDVNKAIFLDRDGTINEDKGYVSSWNEWEWIPKTFEALEVFKELGFLTIIITNQSGIARKYYSEEAMQGLHRKVQEELQKKELPFTDIYFSPHHPDFSQVPAEEIQRKPDPGMILDAAKKWDIDLNKSYMVGDKRTDIEAALNAGVEPVLVLTGKGLETKNMLSSEKNSKVATFDKLWDFAHSLKRF
jgi:D-glycero-D-manno-heptose 1,7-bisphosphate phosphatase